MNATLRTARLVLTPLEEHDVEEMVGVLADVALYRFTGGEPPTVEQLRRRYERQVAGSLDPGEQWHNWIVRLASTNVAIGTVQATVTQGCADVAWLIGVAWQNQGYASEAAGSMCTWLRGQGVSDLAAHIHPDHEMSGRVAMAVGLRRTSVIDAEGESVWSSVEH